MSRFYHGFTSHVSPLKENLGNRGNAARDSLAEKGFVVASGVTQYFAGGISLMAQQPHIAEYCPGDQTTRRFATRASTAAWLRRGRVMFLLLDQANGPHESDLQLAGYAWTGEGSCEQLPDHPITSAYRLGQRALGRGLSRDFIQTVVGATDAQYAEGKGIGLETWQSNHAASVYQDAGFELVAQGEPEMRPTLDPEAADGLVKDVRLYMAYCPQQAA